MSVTATPHVEALPDMEGKVHGIKSDAPWTVQCDDCLTVFSGEHLIVVAQAAIFNARSGTRDRLCSSCWEGRGWRNGHKGWEQA